MALGFVGFTHQPPLYLFSLQKKRKKKKREKREKKRKKKKRFPIKGGKLKQVGNENFSPQGWKNGKIEFVAQEMTSKRRIFQKYTRTSKTMKTSEESECIMILS